jgi:Fe-Mn family superoxide dismutase
MKRELEPLPYPENALEPFLSAWTIGIHYGKHHRGYLDKLRTATEGQPEANHDLETLIRVAEGDLFNNAAQVWNHTFYWKCMRPPSDEGPDDALHATLGKSFGSLAAFKREFAEAANGEFGSGWAWLVREPDDRLVVRSSSDADNPLRAGATPLLTLDVWEHAYYLDYQNDRGRYVEGFLDHLIDWGFVGRNLAAPDKAAAGGN